jgi:hypothetical protein
METRMLAVTIGVGEKFTPLAQMAAASCASRTGLPVAVLGEEAMRRHGLKKPHHLKFKLFDEFPDAETILYFDSDIIFLRDFDPRPFVDSRDFICVRDIWDCDWVINDARQIGLAPRDYFNSGFFILNRTHHALMLRLAARLQGRFRVQFDDQTALNAARAWLDVPTRYLPREYNYLVRENDGSPDTEQAFVLHLCGFERKAWATQLRYHQYWKRNPVTDSPRVQEAARQLIDRDFIYERVGHDRRPMRLAPAGAFAQGAAGCENRWRLTEEEGRPVLWLANRHLPTCAMEEDAAGTWEGRWLHWEQMPVRLCPAGC